MLKGSKIRPALFVALLAFVLIMAATAGAVWHHHSSAAAESSCAICHLGHQAFQQPAVIQSAPVFFAVGLGPVFTEPLFLPELFTSRAATRAPPSL
jgi:hypothetical protein